MSVRKKGLFAGIVLAAVGAAAVFFMIGPPRLLASSSQPDFCAGCHVMEAEFMAWSHAGAHRRKLCVDCHLPNENVAVHYLWKSLDGLKDVVAFYSGRVPDRIEVTEHGRQVLQANCVRCHEEAVEMIGQERPCWACHRRIAHRRSGSIETLATTL
ncbi:MAG: cytochrome c nitrite reductase small subunit [Thermodesulfobacteriota bacterium]